ncbi:hypothetical protein CERZMDRAFT_89660 [Cercospora zeae-maydis SCOH1-5]|uniref:Uncharacterized protein n=1 Tax=Cercospora zeae-maydis SCOH1-5 TaxID=717836 RepID=A0A6A6FXN5_9PEZI|nr:hypothetical protein CERZMDRAFT_89660 [Cercospora zeae-maydis SCOH1-5]
MGQIASRHRHGLSLDAVVTGIAFEKYLISLKSATMSPSLCGHPQSSRGPRTSRS